MKVFKVKVPIMIPATAIIVLEGEDKESAFANYLNSEQKVNYEEILDINGGTIDSNGIYFEDPTSDDIKQALDESEDEEEE